MKKTITSLLLLVGMAQAQGIYIGYDYLANVNYDNSGVNKDFDVTAFTWKVGYDLNSYFGVEARAGVDINKDTKKNLITDAGFGLTTARVELNRLYSALLKGSYPLVECLKVNGYVGASSVKFVVDSNQNYHSENSDSSVSVGAGLSYDIGQKLFLNADYMAYTKNVKAIQVGMGFRF